MIPNFDKTFFKTQSEKYELGGGAYEYSFDGVSLDGCLNYARTLENSGFRLYSENRIDENRFFIYVRDDTAVGLSFYPSITHDRYDFFVKKPNGRTNYDAPTLIGSETKSFIKLSVFPTSYLPDSQASAYKKLTDATVTQVAPAVGDNGMSYVIQLEDGSFLIVDGGLGRGDSKECLMSLLESMKPSEHQKPRVNWLFTHAHPDHIALPLYFIREYSDRVDNLMAAYNFVNEEADCQYTATFRDGNRLGTAALMREIERVRMRKVALKTGQSFCMAGCRIDVLITQEDIFPRPLGTINAASCIVKLTFTSGDKQRSLMILGDTNENSASFVNSAYSPDTLRCDIVQAAHHAVTASRGGVELTRLYRSIAPDTVLCPNFEQTVTDADFSPNKVMAGATWIYHDKTHTISIF